MQPLPTVLTHVVFLKVFLISSAPKNHPSKSDVPLLEVFSCTHHSEFLALTHNIPGMIISKKKEAKVM
jgi:hypothetical protein